MCCWPFSLSIYREDCPCLPIVCPPVLLFIVGVALAAVAELSLPCLSSVCFGADKRRPIVANYLCQPLSLSALAVAAAAAAAFSRTFAVCTCSPRWTRFQVVLSLFAQSVLHNGGAFSVCLSEWVQVASGQQWCLQQQLQLLCVCVFAFHSIACLFSLSPPSACLPTTEQNWAPKRRTKCLKSCSAATKNSLLDFTGAWATIKSLVNVSVCMWVPNGCLHNGTELKSARCSGMWNPIDQEKWELRQWELLHQIRL